MRSLIVALVFLMLGQSQTIGGYLVDGQIEGSVCTNYLVFSICRFVNVDAVEGDDGQLFEIVKRFETVTEHSGDKCFIRIQDGGWGWVSWIIHKSLGPKFLTKTEAGKYERIDPEYVVFKCRKEE